MEFMRDFPTTDHGLKIKCPVLTTVLAALMLMTKMTYMTNMIKITKMS